MVTERQNPNLVRRAYHAGTFYPSDPVALSNLIKTMFSEVAEPDEAGQIVGLVAPHAGYVYSGGCAAAGYGALGKTKYDVVVVVSPSHQSFFDGVSIFDGGGYETPLGVVYVDLDLAREIGEVQPKVMLSSLGHMGGRAAEHALEVQLPFLQVALGDFSVIPIIMGNQELGLATALGEALAAKLVGRKALIVASSDLSHYYSAAVAEKMDGGVLDAVRRYDWKLLHDRVTSGISQACGAGPILACMYAAKRLGAARSKVIQYTHSGKVTGDDSEVVGYFSAIFHT